MFLKSEIDEEVHEILNKEAEKKFKMAQKLTKEKYDTLKHQSFSLLIKINSPEIVIGLKNSDKAMIFLPGKLSIDNYVDKDNAAKVRRYNVYLQKTSLKYSRNWHFASNDWLGMLRKDQTGLVSKGRD
jgi:hypothetical protein